MDWKRKHPHLHPHVQTESEHDVLPARSLNNLFAGTQLPQNPGLAENNYNSGHQDSYCSESVGLTGPVSGKLRMITKQNPYGFTPLMTCNSNNQMIGMAAKASIDSAELHLIVFDSECEIISATEVPSEPKPGQFGSAGKGYFFLDNDNNALTVYGDALALFPTSNVTEGPGKNSLDPIWVSDNLVELITSDATSNSLYTAMPLWQTPTESRYYWVLLSGLFDLISGTLTSSARIAVVKIEQDVGRGSNTYTTTIVDSTQLANQWVNNSMAVIEEGVFFVTNGCDATTGICNSGNLYFVGFDTTNQQISIIWASPYENSGFLKPGQINIGSGTTPTVFDSADGTKYVTITDNAYPRMHLVICQCSNGLPVCKVPVFPKMRGCNDASSIGVQGRVVVENNFGHTVNIQQSQYVANEPGLELIQVGTAGNPCDVIWRNDHFSVFGMSMLARESGIIFAFIGDWNVADATTEGALYSVSAIDSWDGREIWRVPVGRGYSKCHDYGGIYFNHTGTSLYVGTQDYLVSIQDSSQPQ